MFDVGFSELMLVGVIALLVLGPERLPKAARMAGALLRRMRSSLSTLQQDLEREVHAEELKRSLRAAEAAVASFEPNQAVKDAIAELDPLRTVAKPAPAAPPAAGAAIPEVRSELDALRAAEGREP